MCKHSKVLLAARVPLVMACLGSGNACCLRARGDYTTNISKAECVHALKGLALPRASRSCVIALVGSCRLRTTLAAAPVLFAHAIVTEIEIGRVISHIARAS
jgi:hypothetical protein